MADLLSPLFSDPTTPPALSPRQWEDLLGQARRAQLLGRLNLYLNARGWTAHIPDGPRPYLASALRLVDRQRHEVVWELGHIRQALRAIDAPIVLLKGAAYLAAGLPPSQGRLFSDIDILVPRQHIAKVEESLFTAGWISAEHDAYNQRYYREWMHEIPPLTHVHRQSVIDLHHTITPPTSRFKVDGAKLLERIVALEGFQGVFILAPEDMVLHSAVHLFQEGEFGHGLRDLLDLNDLLHHFQSQDFWPRLLARAKELGLQIPLHHALYHVHRLFGTSAPVDLLSEVDALRPHGPSRALMARLLTVALRPQHPSCDTWLSERARWLLYVRSHYLRMPFFRVIPHLIRKAWMRQFPDKPETN